MLNELLHDNIFGKVTAYIYVIEFQKRGLPLVHLLLTLDEESKIRNKDKINVNGYLMGFIMIRTIKQS